MCLYVEATSSSVGHHGASLNSQQTWALLKTAAELIYTPQERLMQGKTEADQVHPPIYCTYEWELKPNQDFNQV